MSSNKTIGVSGKIIDSQARELISNVLDFMKKEATEGLTIPLTNFKQRLLLATKISDKTYRSICKEKNMLDVGAKCSFSSPKRTRRKKNSPKLFNDEQIRILKNAIYNFYVTEKKSPSLKSNSIYIIC